ncbi:MAG TPA: hypothetical protein VIM03_08515, partial [Thermoleophilaceae bacterium]
LNHQDEVSRRVELTVVERVHVESELERRGLASTESQANFSWVALGEEGRLRVTYGTRAENDRFLAALDELL